MKRSIDTAIWGDPWFAEQSPTAKMVFMYLLTCDRSTAAGIFDLSLKRMAFDIGIDTDDAKQAVLDLEGRVRWWPEHNTVWVVNFFRHQAANDNFLKSAQRTFEGLPADIQQEVAQTYPEFCTDPSVEESTAAEPMPTGSKPVPTGMQTHSLVNSEELIAISNQGSVVVEGADAPQAEPESQPKTKPKPKRATQIPDDWWPSESLKDWAMRDGFTVDETLGEVPQFVDFWIAKGDSRKDWDASFRTWMRNSRKFNRGSPPAKQPVNQRVDSSHRDDEAYWTGGYVNKPQEQP